MKLPALSHVIPSRADYASPARTEGPHLWSKFTQGSLGDKCHLRRGPSLALRMTIAMDSHNCLTNSHSYADLHDRRRSGQAD